MKQLKFLLEEIINEDKLTFIGGQEKQIRDKWLSLVEKDTLSEKELTWVNKTIPVSEELLNKISETSNKYFSWILSIYKKNFKGERFMVNKPMKISLFSMYEDQFIEDLYKIKNDLKLFEIPAIQSRITKDLNLPRTVTIEQFKSGQELHKAVEPYIERKFASNKDQVQSETIVFKGDMFDVYVPKDEEQSCILGSNTNWCTAADSENNKFNYYNKKGKLYILINRSNPTEKYQFHFEDGQFTDKNDDNVKISKILEKDSKIFIFFTPILEEEYNSVVLDDEYLGKITDTFLLKFNKVGTEINCQEQLPLKLAGQPIFQNLNCSLENISINNSTFEKDGHCYDLNLYKNIANLDRLELRNCHIDESVAKWIGALPNLKYLILYHSNIEGENFNFLRNSPIEYLNIGYFNFSNVKNLKGYMQSYFTQNDFNVFTSMSNLKDLTYTDHDEKYNTITIKELKEKGLTVLKNSNYL